MMADEIAQRLMPLLVRRTWRRGLVLAASLGYGTRMRALASGAVPLALAMLMIAGTSASGRGALPRAGSPSASSAMSCRCWLPVSGSPPKRGCCGCPAPSGR